MTAGALIAKSSIHQYGTRVLKKIRREGIYNTFIQACLRVESSFFDKRYGVDTHQNIPLSDLDIASESVRFGRQYQPVLVNHLRRILASINFSSDDVLVDFGSGKGRVLLISAMHPFKKVVGVEFSDHLCSIAKENIRRMKLKDRLCPIEVHCIDAAEYEIKKEETIFFFFNPFDKAVMRRVINNIEVSYAGHPRKIQLVYLNLKSQELGSDSGPFRSVKESSLHGLPLHIYETI